MPCTSARSSLPTEIASAVTATSCGIGDIDRAQPNKLRKSVLAGEWYYQQTVVDAPYTTSFTFIGEQSEKTERLTWDVQERYLIAYRSYDLVAGTDGPSTVSGGEADKVPLAVFPIESHFDVVREYNAQTGEQSNVIVENSLDRPWYEREWLRVALPVARSITSTAGGSSRPCSRTSGSSC